MDTDARLEHNVVLVPRLLLRREAAELLRVSVRTLDRLIAGRELEAAIVGRQVRIPSESVVALIERGRQAPVAHRPSAEAPQIYDSQPYELGIPGLQHGPLIPARALNETKEER